MRSMRLDKFKINNKTALLLASGLIAFLFLPGLLQSFTSVKAYSGNIMPNASFELEEKAEQLEIRFEESQTREITIDGKKIYDHKSGEILDIEKEPGNHTVGTEFQFESVEATVVAHRIRVQTLSLISNGIGIFLIIYSFTFAYFPQKSAKENMKKSTLILLIFIGANIILMAGNFAAFHAIEGAIADPIIEHTMFESKSIAEESPDIYYRNALGDCENFNVQECNFKNIKNDIYSREVQNYSDVQNYLYDSAYLGYLANLKKFKSHSNEEEKESFERLMKQSLAPSALLSSAEIVLSSTRRTGKLAVKRCRRNNLSSQKCLEKVRDGFKSVNYSSKGYILGCTSITSYELSRIPGKYERMMDIRFKEKGKFKKFCIDETSKESKLIESISEHAEAMSDMGLLSEHIAQEIVERTEKVENLVLEEIEK